MSEVYKGFFFALQLGSCSSIAFDVTTIAFQINKSNVEDLKRENKIIRIVRAWSGYTKLPGSWRANTICVV